MATLAQNVPKSQPLARWFWEFLKEELAPYAGRAGTVARMVIAATLIMIVCITFRIPYAWQGAIYALLVSRESRRATVQSAATIFLVTGISVAYLLVSMWFVINVPLLHFVWVIATLFLAFYGIRVLTNYLAAVAFVNTISIGIPLWDRHVPAEINVEDTLRLCLATLIAVMITAGVELAFARRRPGDEVVLHISDRLSAVETLLSCYADGRAVDPGTKKTINRLEMVGTSLLRRILRRSDYSPQYSANMAAVAALAGRLIDLAATLGQLRVEPSASDQRRFRKLASVLASICNNLMNREIPRPVEFGTDEESSDVPLLSEMEYTVTLIPQAFAGSRSVHEYVPSPDDIPRPALLAPDALINPEHLRFALKGCLAASSSYVIYNAIAWPGISTAVTTCLLTALSTIGASRQKQFLRITGAIVGGFLLGMGSQIFILPYIDSIAGFTVLFVFVTALAAWFMTSSPRLSYFGVQVALAFYLIHLEEFKIRTSLGVARDRVVGVLLGLSLMWLVFDQLWSTPAGVEIRRLFASNFRLLAQLARGPVSKDVRVALANSFVLRERIDVQLDQVRSLADGVLFEFGPSRRRDLEMRSRIRQLQPKLRTLLLMRIASLKYRLELPGFELPEAVRHYQREYDARSAEVLEKMADAIEGKPTEVKVTEEHTSESLGRVLEECCGPEARRLPALRVDSFVTLLCEIDQLTASLAKEIETEFRPSITADESTVSNVNEN
jgi:multidrug resistance protein MdtO